MKRNTIILSAIIAVLALSCGWIAAFINSRPAPNRGITRWSPSLPWNLNSENGVRTTNQYSTLLKTRLNAERTAFGGSLNFSHLEEDPRY
jgi:hypothetical protein